MRTAVAPTGTVHFARQLSSLAARAQEPTSFELPVGSCRRRSNAWSDGCDVGSRNSSSCTEPVGSSRRPPDLWNGDSFVQYCNTTKSWDRLGPGEKRPLQPSQNMPHSQGMLNGVSLQHGEATKSAMDFRVRGSIHHGTCCWRQCQKTPLGRHANSPWQLRMATARFSKQVVTLFPQ